MLVVVGSENRIKIEAVKRAFQKLNLEAMVVGVEVETSVGPQPIGIEATLKGALERASKALRKEVAASLGVGVEAGLVKWPAARRYLDQHVAAVMDRQGGLTLGGGPAFELPPKVLSEVLKRRVEVDTTFEELTGIKRIGKSRGIIGFLSEDKVVRRDLVEAAVLMALTPRLKPSHYKVSGLDVGKEK